MNKLIEEFKKSNGNVTFTNKEILMYIAGRLDRVDKKIESLSGSIISVKARLKYYWAAIGVISSILAFIIKKGL